MAVLINMAASVLIGKRIKYSGNETEAGLPGASCVRLSVDEDSKRILFLFRCLPEKCLPVSMEVEGLMTNAAASQLGAVQMF